MKTSNSQTVLLQQRVKTFLFILHALRKNPVLLLPIHFVLNL